MRHEWEKGPVPVPVHANECHIATKCTNTTLANGLRNEDITGGIMPSSDGITKARRVLTQRVFHITPNMMRIACSPFLAVKL